MELKIFFDSLDETEFQHISSASSWLSNISPYFEEFPDWKDADIAIIGVNEERGSSKNKGTAYAPDQIRKKLYELKKWTGSFRIVDFGNLRSGVNLEETYLRIKEVCEVLISHNILPLIIGGSHDLDYGQFLAYKDLEKLVNVLSVDAYFDLDQDFENAASKSHTYRILIEEPNYLFNFNQMGYQSYLNSKEEIEIFERFYFDSFRLGAVRDNIKEMEPVIRGADMLSFDITAIKSSDAPGNENGLPFGLTGEEACQVCWYAGINDKLSSIGFYEYNPVFDKNGHTASVIATMIWYFVEGFYHRKGDKDFRSQDYLKYVVAMPSANSNIVFYKSKLTDKWWMEVPYSTGIDKVVKNFIIPCSYEDYQTAGKGEMPERWINTKAKF